MPKKSRVRRHDTLGTNGHKVDYGHAVKQNIRRKTHDILLELHIKKHEPRSHRH